MNSLDFNAWLIENKACHPAINWALGKTSSQAWEECRRGDWLLWLADKQNHEIRSLMLAKARCAKLVIHLMNDQRSINAVNVAEKFGLGTANEKELASAAIHAKIANVDALDIDSTSWHASRSALVAALINGYAWMVPVGAANAAEAWQRQHAGSKSFTQTLLQCAEIVRETIKPNWI